MICRVNNSVAPPVAEAIVRANVAHPVSGVLDDEKRKEHHEKSRITRDED